MSKIEWFAHKGLLVKCGNFTRTYEKTMPRGSHMRMGRFAVCVAHNKSEVVIGRAFECHNLDDPQCNIDRGSRHWDSHKRDRLSQIAAVKAALRPEHPLFAEITADMQREQEHFA